jgi:hypothetical protein
MVQGALNSAACIRWDIERTAAFTGSTSALSSAGAASFTAWEAFCHCLPATLLCEVLSCERFVGGMSLSSALRAASCDGWGMGGWPLAFLWLAKHAALAITLKHEADYAYHRGCVSCSPASPNALFPGDIGSGSGFQTGLGSGSPVSTSLSGTAINMLRQSLADPAGFGLSYAFAAFCLNPAKLPIRSRLLVGPPGTTVLKAMSSYLTESGTESRYGSTEPSSVSGVVGKLARQLLRDVMDAAWHGLSRRVLSTTMEMVGRCITWFPGGFGQGPWFDESESQGNQFHFEESADFQAVCLALLPAKWLCRSALPAPAVARCFGLVLRNPKHGAVPGTVAWLRSSKDLEFDQPVT